MSTQGNTALVRRAVTEIWNDLDIHLADALFGPDYVNHGGLIPDLVTGPESIKSAVVLWHTAFPRLYLLEEALVAERNLVELTWIAGNDSESPIDLASGGRRTARGRTLMVCAGEQITESWTTWDCFVSGEALAAHRRTQRLWAAGYRRAG